MMMMMLLLLLLMLLLISSLVSFSDEKKARSDDKAQLLALPEPRHAVYSLISIACGVACFVCGTGLSATKAAALAALPALGERRYVHLLNIARASIWCARLTVTQAP